MKQYIERAMDALRQQPGLREALGYPERGLAAHLDRVALASGNFADVFAAPKSRFGNAVLKLTRDPDQAALSIAAQRDRPHGIVQVHFVTTLLEHEWAIVEKFVVPLPNALDPETWTASTRQRMLVVADAAQEAYSAVSGEVDMLTADGLLFPDTIEPEGKRPASHREGFEWDLRKAVAWIIARARTAADAADMDLHARNLGIDVDPARLVVLDLGQVRVGR